MVAFNSSWQKDYLNMAKNQKYRNLLKLDKKNRGP